LGSFVSILACPPHVWFGGNLGIVWLAAAFAQPSHCRAANPDLRAVRRAPAHPTKITAEMRREIRRLANTTEMTLHEISEVVGVRNIGRVSEVLNGKC
jgi:hypothetical protein